MFAVFCNVHDLHVCIYVYHMSSCVVGSPHLNKGHRYVIFLLFNIEGDADSAATDDYQIMPWTWALDAFRSDPIAAVEHAFHMIIQNGRRAPLQHMQNNEDNQELSWWTTFIHTYVHKLLAETRIFKAAETNVQ